MYKEKNEDGLGNNLYLNSSWTVWVHKQECQTWTEESYTNVYAINSIGTFWRFFNNFHLIDKVKNQLFIMRNKIKPIWEDNANKNGETCSIKLECYSRQGKIDVSVEIMICICLLVMNETFFQNNEEINGISYAIKNKSVLIKLWCKNYTGAIKEQLPTLLINKFITALKPVEKSINNSRRFGDSGRYNDNRYQDSRYGGDKPRYNGEGQRYFNDGSRISIKCVPIKPEYELDG